MMAKNNHVSLRRSSSHWSRLVRGGVIRFGFYFLLCALSFVFLYPFIKMITQSLMTDDDLINITVKWLPSKLTWSNYAVAYRKLMFKSYVWNSARVAIICTLGHVLSCAMTGYAFARYKFRFKGALFAMVILTMLVPVQTVIIPQYMQFSNWGWLNSEYYLPLVVPSFLGFGLNGAFFIFLFRQFFSGMPYEMEEAARVDGCGPIRTFLHIMLPMSQSSLLVCTVLSIVWHWNDYFEPGVYFNSVWLKMLPNSLPNLYAELNKEQHTMIQTNDIEGIIFNEAMLMAATLPGRASAVQSWSAKPCMSWPVISRRSELRPRRVRLWPIAATAAEAAVMPGTTDQAIPAASRASISSSSRPKTVGSPDFRRTTCAPRPAWASSRALISA